MSALAPKNPLVGPAVRKRPLRRGPGTSNSIAKFNPDSLIFRVQFARKHAPGKARRFASAAFACVRSPRKRRRETKAAASAESSAACQAADAVRCGLDWD